MNRLATITRSIILLELSPSRRLPWAHLKQLILSILLLSNLLNISSIKAAELPEKGQNWRPSELYYGSYLATDRQKKREIEVAEKLIEGQKYTDGIRLLTQILASESDLLDPDRTSLKRQAAKLVSSLPAAGQRTYATMFENQLERDLGIALEQRDQNSLAKLAAQFPPETWGNSKSNRLNSAESRGVGQSVGKGVWEAWAWSQQELGNYAIASAIRSAIANHSSMSSDPQAANPQGNQFAIPFDKRLSMVKEETSLEPPTERWLDRNTPRQWLGPGGGAGRRFESVGANPTSWRSWHSITAEGASLLDALQSQMPEQAAMLPASNAIAVEGIIVVRQAEHLIAIDADSGKRQWLVNLDDETKGSSREFLQKGSDNRLPAQIDPLGEAAWLDRVQGTLTSDSRSVFVITASQNRDNTSQNNQSSRGRGFRSRNSIVETNALACYDLAREGKLRWRLDGKISLWQEGSSAQFEGVRFLGAPTPVEDWLAVLVEQQGMIRLLLLESQTGKLIWQQPLVSYTGMNQTDTLRRIGVSPTWHRGMLYCPTGAGVIMAVDPLRRSIAWVAHVPIDKKLITKGNLSAGRTGLRTADSRLRNGNGWRDTRITAQGDRVVVATSESNRLSCFDSSTGELRWSNPMDNGLLLSSVTQVGNESQIVVIESKSLAAISLKDGSKIWRVFFNNNDRPAGDGLLLDQEYLLPLQSGRLARVSLSVDVSQRISYIQQGTDPLDRPAMLGNLLAHRGAFYARSPFSIERYDQPVLANRRLFNAESKLEKGDYEKAYAAFDFLLDKKMDQDARQEELLHGRGLINRRDASALLAERDGGEANSLNISADLESEQRIEPLLYRFQSLMRRKELDEAKVLAHTLLNRPESKTAYVALSNKRVVQIERWVHSQLSMLEETPRLIELGEEESLALSRNMNPLKSTNWSTNQVTATLSVAESNSQQTQQQTKFIRRNIRASSAIPQRLGVRGDSNWLAKWEVYNTGGDKPDLVGRNGFGEIAFSEQLPGAVEGPLLASVVGESASCCWGNRMLMQLGESVVAYDLSTKRDTSRLLWNSQTLSEVPLNTIPLYASNKDGGNVAKRLIRNRSDRGDKVYCLDAWGAIVRREGEIACVDSSTGNLIWSVNDWHSYDRIFSYGDHIYFGRTSSRVGVILSKQDGRKLGDWHVPNGDWRKYQSGRLLLTMRGEAKLYDLTQNKDIPLWRSNLKNKQYAIIEGAILLLDNGGLFECVDMATGEVRFEVKLDLPSSRLPFLQAWVVGKQLLVSVSKQSTSGHRQLGFTPLGERPLVTGLLYNLDRQSGKPNWPHPVELEGAGLLQDCRDDSQLLCFGGRVQNTQSNNGVSRNRLLVIDIASGRSIYRNDRLPAARQGRANFQVLKEVAARTELNSLSAGNSTSEQLLVQLGAAQLRLEVTYEPSPPNPPALAQIERPRKRGIDFNEFSQEFSRLFEEITQPIEKPEE